MPVTPGQVLNVYVGGQAGYNGGGLGHAVGNRNGGGASDVRVSPYALANRVIVAGAGHGGGPTDVGIRNGGTGGGGGYGGNGGPGGINGGTGNTSCHSGGAGGGGLNSGGAPSCNTCYTSTCGQAGTLGQGGAADVWESGICYTSYGGTNGGGGYYGGGGSSVGNCGGCGSSWVGTLTNTTMTGGIRTGNGQIVITVLYGINITQSTQILCFGQASATLTAAPFGGTSPYTYSWAPSGGTSATATGLIAGTYTVTVASPSALTPTATSSSVLCNGDTATVTVAGAGGTSPYTGEGTFMEMAGTYSYTVTDANGCTSTTSVTITEPTAISTGVTSVDVTCNGGADGSIDLTVSGGTGPYTFDWNSGTYTTEDLTGLNAGTYVGAHTDANGCTDGGTIIINEPSALVATLAIANDTVCSTDAAFTLTGESPAGGVFSGPGVAAGSFDPAKAGVGVHAITYVYTDSSGCTATTTDSISVDVCTGTLFPVSGSEFSVYPNPNDGTFVLQTTSAADVMIYDAQGKLVHTQKVQPNVATPMNIESTGMYMITVVTADGQRTSQRVMATK